MALTTNLVDGAGVRQDRLGLPDDDDDGADIFAGRDDPMASVLLDNERHAVPPKRPVGEQGEPIIALEVFCDRKAPLGDWRNARLVIRDVLATIRRTGRVTLRCAVCSTRTDVSVRQQPVIWMG